MSTQALPLVTTTELIELVGPFAGAKLNPPRDPGNRWRILPQTAAVDILCRTNKINADVRAVTAAGIEVFFYDRCETVPWAEVQRVVVRELDGNGETIAQTVYERRERIAA